MTPVVIAMLCQTAVAAAAATPPEIPRLLAETGVSGGLVVHVGCGDGAWTAALRAAPAFVVHGLDRDPARVDAALTRFAADPATVGAVSAAVWRGGRLPYAEDLVRLLVVEPGQDVTEADVLRVLAPGGAAALRDGQGWRVLRKPVPDTIDDWPQYFYASSNNAVSRDRQVGPPRSLQWWASPIAARSHNWGASTAAMVSAGGRMAYVQDEGPIAVQGHTGVGMNWAKPKTSGETPLRLPERWNLICRDAMNGVLLWKRALTGWGQWEFEQVGPSQPTFENTWSTPLSLNRRVAMDGQRVYATLDYRGQVSAVDATSGATLWTAAAPGIVDEVVLAGDVLFLRVRPQIPRKDGRVWGKEDGPAFDAYVESLPPERVVAVDAATGAVRWERPARQVAAETLAAHRGRVCYFDLDAVVCLDATSGAVVWRQEQPKPEGPSTGRGRYLRLSAGMLLMHEDLVILARNQMGTAALRLADGGEVWRAKSFSYGAGFGHPLGMRVMGDKLWNDRPSSLLVATGVSGPNLPEGSFVGGTHGRCFRGKAAGDWLITSKYGVEFLDQQLKVASDDRWLRSICAYGFMPANGLLYNAPDACACMGEVRLRGFNALSPRLAEAPEPLAAAHRLVRAAAAPPPSRTADPADWPTFRRDAARSGSTPIAVPAAPAPQWRTALGGRLTQPVVGDGRVLVVRRDAAELVCLGLDDGAVRWRRALGATAETPPALDGDRVLLGTIDGWMHCLDARDGALVWRYRVAPNERLIIDDGRIASAWPVPGTPVVAGGVVATSAGRSTFLDGGVSVVLLDAATGTPIRQGRCDGPWYAPNQVNDIQIGKAGHGAKVQPSRAGEYPWVAMEGARNEVLTSDGTDLFLGQLRVGEGLANPEAAPRSGGQADETPPLPLVSTLRLRAEGKPAGGQRLRALTGFTDDTYFHRSGWLLSDTYTGGGNSAGAATAGKILVFGEGMCFGAHHEGSDAGRYPNHRVGQGTLLVADRIGTANAQEGFNLNRSDKPVWTAQLPILVRAQVATGGAQRLVFCAGPDDRIDPADPLAAYDGRGPARLLAIAAADGQVVAEMALPAQPVYDGLIAARDGLLVSLTDGSLLRLR